MSDICLSSGETTFFHIYPTPLVVMGAVKVFVFDEVICNPQHS